LTSLTAIFGSSQEESGDSEKLLELYWNRAELKKEFARLRDETFELKDQIKTKEGAAARLQQKLDHLENLLLDPEWVYNVMIYYQLRALNQRCVNRVARFAEQLKQQREKRQHAKLLQAWNGERKGQAHSIKKQIGEQRMHMQVLEDQLQAERHRLSSMHGFLRFFRKRSITKMLDNIAEQMAVAQARESELLAELSEIQAREAPDTQGLDIAAKRSINFMILSYAQQLYLHFAEDNLAAFSKESGDKSIGAIKYGSKQDCDFLLQRVIKRGDSLQNASEFADILQHRARLLSEDAKFKGTDDAVPIVASVSTLFDIDENAAISRGDADLLGENYWGLQQVMSR
jgi:hypothetical protein